MTRVVEFFGRDAVWALRIPGIPIDALVEVGQWPQGASAAEASYLTRKKLLDYMKDHSERLAIHLSSPSFAAQLRNGSDREAMDDSRFWRTLSHYFLRCVSRPTPFGHFAGVAAGRFGGETTIRMKDVLCRESRIDVDGETLRLVTNGAIDDPSVLGN